jgi:hypothetical protein
MAVERPLKDKELSVLQRLIAVERQGAEAIRESLPYLVDGDECDCGCESFGIRDARSPLATAHDRAGGPPTGGALLCVGRCCAGVRRSRW